MTHLELRKKFFDFWTEPPRNHKLIPSAPLVPENDPTTLFTGSGMQPLIPYLLGQSHPLGQRLVDIQKCFRGQDIDEVGDNRHDTFFEMMGNWSFGDYFKKDQLAWYYEFLTKILGINPEKLYISCFEGYKNIPKDTESAEIWKSLGIPENKIYFYGVDKNWWSRSGTPDQMPVGEIGGPDSEVYYEFTDVPHNPKYGEKCHPACDCGRFLEIGNSVFIQYQKQGDGSFKELPQKNVDFGGGIERALAAVNNDPDIFKTDLFSDIIEVIEETTSKKYSGENEKPMRVIADHMKSAVFLIKDGVIPSNKDRGYILRKLIRRAAVKYFSVGGSLAPSNLFGIADRGVLRTYNGIQNIDKNTDIDLIDRILNEETDKFLKTMDQGLKLIDKLSPFDLFQTYGFQPEITEELLKQKGKKMDWESFNNDMRKHQELSRTASAGMFKGGLVDHSEQVTKYHTATHLLQAALRKVLGEHVHQEGSNLTGERLRFDFSHNEKLTPEQIKEVENLVNEQVEKGLERKVETITYDEAIKSGAMAFFKERYPEKVTVYSFGNFSKEICGGPHVENINVLGKFKITKEESVAAGIRRIYAVLE